MLLIQFLVSLIYNQVLELWDEILKYHKLGSMAPGSNNNTADSISGFIKKYKNEIVLISICTDPKMERFRKYRTNLTKF